MAQNEWAVFAKAYKGFTRGEREGSPSGKAAQGRQCAGDVSLSLPENVKIAVYENGEGSEPVEYDVRFDGLGKFYAGMMIRKQAYMMGPEDTAAVAAHTRRQLEKAYDRQTSLEEAKNLQFDAFRKMALLTKSKGHTTEEPSRVLRSMVEAGVDANEELDEHSWMARKFCGEGFNPYIGKIYG